MFAGWKNLPQMWQTKVDQTPTPQKVTFNVSQFLNFMSFWSKEKDLTCNILHQMYLTCPASNVWSDCLQYSSSLPIFQTSTRHNSVIFWRFEMVTVQSYADVSLHLLFFKERKCLNWYLLVWANMHILWNDKRPAHAFQRKMRRLCVNGVTHCSAKAAEWEQQ